MKYLIQQSKIYIQKHIVSVGSLIIVLFALIFAPIPVYAESIQLIPTASDQNRSLGAYHSRVGICMGCHTA